MLSHVFTGVTDFRIAFQFYSAIMGELGLKLKFCDTDQPLAAWMLPDQARPLFLIGHPYDGSPASPGNGPMLALSASSRSVVDRVHAAALKHGGRCEGPPDLRPQYHIDYYGAYFRDPDGNKLCVCCHDAVR